MSKTVCIVGAFDPKGPEYAFLRERVLEAGAEVFTINTGVLGTTDLFAVDVEADAVASAAGGDLAAIRKKKDRGEAMRAMEDSWQNLDNMEGGRRNPSEQAFGSYSGSTVTIPKDEALGVEFDHPSALLGFMWRTVLFAHATSSGADRDAAVKKKAETRKPTHDTATRKKAAKRCFPIMPERNSASGWYQTRIPPRLPSRWRVCCRISARQESRWNWSTCMAHRVS